MYDSNEENKRMNDERVDGEYSFSYNNERTGEEGERARAYSDAGYIPASEAPKITPKYNSYYNASEQSPKRKEKRSSGFGKVVALFLCCAVIGGSTGYLGATLANNNNTDDSRNSAAVFAPANNTPELPDGKEDIPAATPSASGNTATPAISVDGTEMGAEQLYEMACPQTVGISSEITMGNIFGQASSSSVSGSGFIISSDGYILTNYHVVQEAYARDAEIKVMLHNGNSYPAEVVGFENDGTDIAVLKIDVTGLSPVTIGDSDSMRVGETVYALGNPLGELLYSITRGMVSAMDRIIATSQYEADSINMFQVDVAINNGNSGGPIFNSRGQVVGIATAKYTATGVEGLGFALPINDAVNLANDIIENGYVSGKAELGIVITNSYDHFIAQYYGMPEGAYVFSVNEGSCSETAGIQSGDVIVAIDDNEIKSYSDLKITKRDYSAGDTATVKIYRNGEYLDLAIVFDEVIITDAGGNQAETGTDTSKQRPERPFSQDGVQQSPAA